MRPLKLTMSAFGSYAGIETIDFTKVKNGVFLITGDTGSGKTTIFDAIAYALYDQTSGGRRDGNMMRSQYADLSTKTYVELDFEYKGKVYRIYRNPEYERESKRKDKDGNVKKTMEKSKVELYMPDGTEFIGKKQEINRKIAEIIGLDVSQFTQISMIAQGEFLKLLLAKSDERKEIFSKLFDTRIFAQIQRNLRERAKHLYGQLQDEQKTKDRELSHLIYADDLEGREYERQIKDSFHMEEILEIIRVMNDGTGRQEQECKEESLRIQKNLDELNRDLTIARENNLLFEKYKEAKWQKEESDKQIETYQNIEVRLEKASRAEKVHDQEIQLESEKKRLQNLESSLGRLENELRILQNQQTEQSGLKEQLAEAKGYEEIAEASAEQMKAVRVLKDRLGERDSIERRQKTAYERLQNLKSKYQQAEDCYQRMNDAFLQEQAGILANELSENQPCPVCGSLEHPKLAVLSEKAPSQKEVSEAKKKRDASEKERDIYQAEFISEQQKYVVFIEHLNIEGRQLFEEKFDLDNPELAEMICETEQELLAKYRDASGKIKELKKKILPGKTEISIEELQTILDEKEREIAEAINRKIGEAAEKNKQKKEFEELIKQAEAVFAQMQKVAGFATEEMYRDSLLEKKEQDRLAKRCKEFRENQIRIHANYQIRQEEVKGKSLIDTSVIESKRADLQKQKEEREILQKKLFRQIENNKSISRQLKKIYEKTKELQKKYAVLQNLSQTASGNLSGSAKIDFEAYVQRQYFRKIIAQANKRLAKMTGNKFLLRCRALDSLAVRGSAGLDLDVYSLLTGTIRDVRTLSGGESFMAALAMALGLADVVQNMAGGIQLNMMFVDEGFGSLDEYSREQAMEVLAELAGGNQLIGIISHVTELKENIEQQLVVKKGKKGSHTVWQFE